ncbi:MAG: class I SAM-dependent methyltransferase [Thermaerobacter sp.]|nr:class I SAM-dependent methyltransferase [Thermaerobacter sp.]
MAETSELFNEIASHYERWSNLLSGEGIRAWRRFAVDRMNLSPGMHVLDVGCGTGAATRMIAKRMSSRGKVVGLDPAEAMLSVGKNTPIEADAAPIEWVVGFGEHLPFEDNVFDRVTAQFSLRNMNDWVAGLGEMVRVLKYGGELTILEMVQPVTTLGTLARRGLDAITAKIPTGGLAPYQWLGASLRHAPTAEELRSEAERIGIDSTAAHHWLGDLVVVVSGAKTRSITAERRVPANGTVIWGIDGSITSFRGAQVINQFINPGTTVHIVTVIPDRNLNEQIRRTDEQFWQRQHKTAENLLLPAKFHIETNILEGDPGRVLIGFAHETHARIIVVGNKCRNPSSDYLMGSVARYVFSHSPVPVLLVPTDIAAE